MSPGRPPTARDWLLAALVGVLAVIVRAAVQPVLGDQLPFLVAFPATVLAALLWGAGPGLVTAVLCAGAVVSPILPPDIPRLERPVQVGGFLLASIVVTLLCGQLGRTRSPQASELPSGRLETPLTTWLRTVLWGAFLIPTTSFVIAAWWGFQHAEEDAQAAVSHACDLAYRQAQRTFSIVADIAARADAVSSATDDEARGSEALIHQRLSDMAAGLPSVVNLNVWDAEGRPLAGSDMFPVDPKANVVDRTYFKEQRDRSMPLGISEVIQGRQTGLELANATIRRASKDGSFRGIVAVSVAPSFFRDYYQSLASEDPKLATFTLIRIDGEILARWPPTPDGRTHVPSASPVLARVASGDTSGSLILPATPGRETRIISFRRLDGYPMYVVAGFSRRAMFTDWARFVGLLAAVLVPVTFGLVYVSWVALKRTRREQATAIELQEQLRRLASAEKSALETQKLETLALVTGGVAHDFNNLLAIVNASLHVLKRRHPEIAEEKQVVAMSRAIQSGVRLTRQLLSFSRKQALRPETINLQNWLPASEGLIQSTLGPNVNWKASVDDATLPIKVDLGELELALINLVVNARHAMPEGGTLTVHAGNAPADSTDGVPMVCLSVQDSGVGIAPGMLARVFEPFFTTRDRGAGSGLGLSQVQGFCAQAGGSARIDSTVGTGTTVRMYLPASGDAVALPETQTLQAPSQLDGRILLVEDNEAVASTTEMMLKSAGLTVARAANADEALVYLATTSEPPHVVLSDIAMPGSMNGIGLAFELRRRQPGLPVLLTTGYADQVNEAMAGGLRVLSKPTDPEELLAELRAVIHAASR